MKALLACLITFLALPAFPQAIWRNFFTTNQNPLVTVVAGSNATVQASTVGVNQRIFTVNAVPGNATFVTTAILTNQVYSSNVIGAVAEATHSTNADNATYITTATITNQVYGTNVVGYVSEASHATNADNAMYGTNATYVLTATITNKVYASNIVSGGQAPASTIEANVGWDGSFLQFSNSSRVWGANADQLTNTTGFSVSKMADTNWINQQIANIGLTLYTTGTTNAGALDGRTNNWQAWNAPIATPVTNTITWDATDPPVNAYLRQLVSTNTFSNIKAGPISVKCYFMRNGAGTLELHPEFYLFDTVEGTLFYEAASAVKQAIAATSTPVAYTWTISSTALTHTNPVKYVVAWKLDTKPNNGSTLSFVAGGSYDSHASFVISLSGSTINANQVVGAGNLIYSNAATARIDMATNASYATNWTMITNTASAGQIPVATSASSAAWQAAGAGSSNIWDSGTELSLGVNSTNTGIIINTNQLQFRNTRANGTNICYIDPATGALLWNTDNINNIGSISANRPKNIYLAGNLYSASGVEAIGSIQAGPSGYLIISGRSSMNSPAVGSVNLQDNRNLSRLYINGPVKALTDEAATVLFNVGARTNALVGGVIDYAIWLQDAATDAQALSGIVTYSACNTGGVWTVTAPVEVAANQCKSVTAGTLTLTWSAAAAVAGGTTNLAVSVTPNTSLTAEANQFYILYQIRNNGTNTITIP